MADDLILSALAGVGLALAAGPLGCFVVWRRMAYFGDATGHATILGVAISLAFSITVGAGVMIITLAMALALSAMAGRGHGVDTLLGVLAHSALALGLVAVALMPQADVDLEAYLFGDIAAVTGQDVALIWGGAIAAGGLLMWRWSALLIATLNDDLASASGINPRRAQLLLMLVLALVVAVAIKLVGALLISAMLIIPAAAARPFARSPEAMAMLAVGIGAIAALGGLQMSQALDVPTGPSIIVVAAAGFVVSLLLRGRRLR